MSDTKANLFRGVPGDPSQEVFTTLSESGAFRLVRIVSTGQATPDDEWYDQDRAEWVAVLKGRAGLRFADEPDERVLTAGDHLLIAPRRRHRVTWTAAGEETVWLALYFDP